MNGMNRTGRSLAMQLDPVNDLRRAQAAMEEAKRERWKAEEQSSFVSRLKDKWEEINKTNALADMLVKEFGRTK